MLHHKQVPSWLLYALDLAQSLYWIGHRTENKRCYSTIKGLVSKRQCLCWCLCNRNRYTRSLYTLAGIAQHRRIRFYCLHPFDLPWLIKSEVKSCACPHFQDHSSSFAGRFPPQRVHKAPLRSATGLPFIYSGKHRVICLTWGLLISGCALAHRFTSLFISSALFRLVQYTSYA